MKLLRGVIAGSVRNPVLANLLGVFFLIGGYYAIRNIPREVFPTISLDHIAIEVAYPGASPDDVERAVCTPIEEALQGIRGIREISSSASENFGTVFLSLMENADGSEAMEEVKDRVDQITSFPPETEKPVVRETVLRTEVINIAIYGDAPERTLKRYAQEVKNELNAREEISQVTLFGAREEEIIIEVSEVALRAYKLTLAEVMQVVAKSSLDLPAGVIRTEEEELTLRVTGQRFSAMDYENLVVISRADAVVHLGEIADISEGFEEGVSRGRFNGQQAVVVAVYRTTGEDALTIARLVREYVDQRQESLPERLRMSVWGDSSVDIDSRTWLFVSNGLWGLVVLFIALAAFFGLRSAFFVCADIPMCFAGALILLWFMDQSINMISLFALIMIGGIIVDDSLVIAESVHEHRKAGLTPELAAIEGTFRMATPVLGATVMTIVMFIPLLFVAGVMGKFIYGVPIVIIAALLVSTIEAFCILPSHLAHREHSGAAARAFVQNRVQRAVDRIVGDFMEKLYRPLYVRAMDHRILTLSLATALLLLTAGLVIGGRTPFVLLPKEDGSILRARVRFPEGTPASVTESAIQRLEEAAKKLNVHPDLQPAKPGDLVRQIYSITGEFADFLPVRGSHLCEVRIELMPPNQRRLPDDRIIAQWRRNVGVLHDATAFTIERQMLGPTDRPIEVRVLGENLDDMIAASSRIEDRLKEFEGVTDVHTDLIPGKRELRVQLRPSARVLGLTLDDVARQLRAAFHGGEAVRLQRGQDEVKVRVRLPEKERRSVAGLESLRITTPARAEIPFLEVAEVTWSRGYADLKHQDGKRRIRIFADIDERLANAKQIIDTLEGDLLPEVMGDYHAISYKFGGDRQRMEESFSSLREGAVIAVFVMYAVLAVMMGSLVQPIVMLVTVPFGLIGSILGHLLLGYDITMMSLFGMVAVSGIVVNHSLVIVDAINHALRNGKSLREAVIEAGEVRFQAVLLSSITDVAGMGPLLVRAYGQAQSVMPMAVSLTCGLVFSVVVTLLIVPAAYLCMNDLRRFGRWLRRGGEYPAAEQVEEAAAMART